MLNLYIMYYVHIEIDVYFVYKYIRDVESAITLRICVIDTYESFDGHFWSVKP